MKALDFLKEQQRRHKNMAESMNLVYFDDELEEAIAELEALQSRSCEGCKYGKERYWDWDSGRHDKDVSFECKILDKSNQLTPYSKHEENKFYCSPTFCCNRYEAKEQL